MVVSPRCSTPGLWTGNMAESGEISRWTPRGSELLPPFPPSLLSLSSDPARFLPQVCLREKRRNGSEKVVSRQSSVCVSQVNILSLTHFSPSLPTVPHCRFMGRGVIELPLEEMSLFIADISHREQWDKHLVVSLNL